VSLSIFPSLPPSVGPLVVGDTIVGNSVAGYREDSSRYAASTIVNGILAANADDLVGLTFDQVRFTDVGDGEFAGAIGNISADPQFVDAANRDFHLLASSPCIETGSTQGATSAAAWLDFDGQARNVDGDRDGVRVVDMGAFEFGRGGVGWRYGDVGAAAGFPEDVVLVNGSPGDAEPGVPLVPGVSAR